jgi:hypothetical protein
MARSTRRCGQNRSLDDADGKVHAAMRAEPLDQAELAGAVSE